MNEGRKFLIGYAVATVAGVVWAGFRISKEGEVRKARKARLAQWNAEKDAALINAYARLEKLAEDPNVTPGEIWQAGREEAKFIGIIADQFLN